MGKLGDKRTPLRIPSESPLIHKALNFIDGKARDKAGHRLTIPSDKPLNK